MGRTAGGSGSEKTYNCLSGTCNRTFHGNGAAIVVHFRDKHQLIHQLATQENLVKYLLDHDNIEERTAEDA